MTSPFLYKELSGTDTEPPDKQIIPNRPTLEVEKGVQDLISMLSTVAAGEKSFIRNSLCCGVDKRVYVDDV